MLGTGNTSGVFYQIGGAYADVITTHLSGYEAIVAPTAGSADNLLRLSRGDVDIALTFADVAADAVRGRGTFAGGGRPLRALAVAYHGYTHLVVRADAGIRTPADLRGKRVSTGTVNSGTEFLALRLIRAAGLDPDRDLRRSSLSLAATTRGLADGTLDATFWSGGLPTVGITELMSTSKAEMRFLPLDGLQAELDRLYPATYGTGRIPASTYGLPGDIPTVTVGNLVVVGADMPEGLAHDLTALIFRYRKELVNGHPEWGSVDRESAGRTGVVQLHPGAQRFYQEG
ncbi:C4-dicarboxylate ABC transporter substrate-binding protein [Phytohabitans suffuscus]|uniref:C4-dicarboxylate ABC transporter substrate-binding protein n=1 Tax=Phytohabitans suffuscus TaxID=624315 RepID=A0A6F8YCS4_9ACTN|nr:TAXI family TRAP transporter solute-binding subunit [Phytohabitans suffuscus]BCB83934.1 C4-dicarboxylate ABC transporter substrate-binding protein [Phytohabitans suffuscus]